MEYIVITDMRQPVGVETIIGREMVLNTSHIVSFEYLDDFLVDLYDAKSIIRTTQTVIYAKESLKEIKNLIDKR